MTLNLMALSLFHHICELEKMHHLIVVEYECMDEHVVGAVHLAQMPLHIVQIFV